MDYRAFVFLSTPSARRATRPVRSKDHHSRISIHALREEGDTPNLKQKKLTYDIYQLPQREGRRHRKQRAVRYFYPRPPRGGRRVYNQISNNAAIFLSTPSARRATPLPLRKYRCVRHFYPRPPRGGRHTAAVSVTPYSGFLSTPSARRATAPMAASGCTSRFLSTPSARRATAKTETKSLFSNKLYNILHEFRRALIYNGSKSYPNHAK